MTESLWTAWCQSWERCEGYIRAGLLVSKSGGKCSSGCKLGVFHEASLLTKVFSDIADTETLKGKEFSVATSLPGCLTFSLLLLSQVPPVLIHFKKILINISKAGSDLCFRKDILRVTDRKNKTSLSEKNNLGTLFHQLSLGITARGYTESSLKLVWAMSLL